MDDPIKDFSIAGIECRKNFSFAKNTTYGVGGLCPTAYFPKTEEEACRLFESLKGSAFVLGCGSNVLAADGYFKGLVIATSALKGIYKSDNSIICYAGTTVAEVLKFCKINGLSGPEFLAGIPASIGGATYMNACACGKSISDILISCTVFDKKLRNFSNRTCNFGYKYSTMRDIDCIITSVRLRVEETDCNTVSKNIEKTLAARAGQPNGRSCGCVFKNPKGISAGSIIESCGLKGYSLNGAAVSDRHANFILNNGASAGDIRKLIQYVKNSVFEKVGILLEEEVVYIGEFDETFG